MTGIFDQPPKLDYTPQYRDGSMQFDIITQAVVYDDSETTEFTCVSGTTSFDTDDFNWNKERDVQILADYLPLSDINLKSGADYTVVLDEDGRFTLAAVADYVRKFQVLYDNIVCNSLKGIKIVNKYDVNILVEARNSTPVAIAKKLLKPGQSWLVTGAKISNVDNILITIYDYNDTDLDSAIINSTTIVYDYLTTTGGISVLLDNNTSLSIAMIGLIGGVGFAGSFLEVEKMLPVLQPLEGVFQSVAKVLGSSAQDIMMGYGAGFLAAVSMGWLSFADIMDFELHQQILASFASNPTAIVAGMAALGGGFTSGLLSQGLSIGASVGISMAVLGYLESIKQYYYPETKA